MTIRHYVLLATDGYINLPTTPDICPAPDTLQQVYVFGFVGGLYKVDDQVINPALDWADPANWPALWAMKGSASIPSPIIWAEVGDHLYITLINLGMLDLPDLPDFHTVHMHGAHVATQLDGFPESSFGVPMWMNPGEAPPAATYFFNPEHPGTQMYHCHVEASEHVQMGMYGALVIYPSYASLEAAGIKKKKGKWRLHGEKLHHIPGSATNRNFAYNDVHTYFDKENVMLLSDIDSTWHEAVRTQDPLFEPVNFKPDFWLINGRAFPDTLLPHPQTPDPAGNPDPNLTQINYESYVHVQTGQKFLLRMINMGYQVVPWHIHGWHFMVAGKDANPSPFLKIAAELELSGHDAHQRGFTATIGSGETYDLLLTADDKRPLYRNYIVNGQDGFPSLCSQMNALQPPPTTPLPPSPIFDIPTEPVTCPPNLVNYIQICSQSPGDPNDNFFPQFYPMHSHDDYKVTNNGAYPGGQLTLIQTDAPPPDSQMPDEEDDDDSDDEHENNNDN